MINLFIAVFITGACFGAIYLGYRSLLIMNNHHPISRRVRAAMDEKRIADHSLETAKFNAARELVELKHQAQLDMARDAEGRYALLGLPSPSEKIEDAEVLDARRNGSGKYTTTHGYDYESHTYVD